MSEVELTRNGERVQLVFEEDLGQFLVDSSIRRPFGLRVPALVETVSPGSGAEAGGLLPGDRIVTLDGAAVGFHGDVLEYLRAHPASDVEVGVIRGAYERLQLTCQTDSSGALGFLQKDPMTMPEFQLEERTYGPGEALVSGFALAWTTLEEYVLSMRFLFSRSGASQVGSLVTFGSIFDAGWNWEIFWRNTAFFSLILAFMNLLPIPALDGGHVVFLLYEMVVGRPAPDKFLEWAQTVGIVLLLGLMALALGNDIWRVITGQFG